MSDIVPKNSLKEQPGRKMRIGEIRTVVQLKDCIKILERYNLRKLWGVYPTGQPRRHFTLTGRGNPNPPDIGTTWPHIHRTPPEANHKSQAPTTPTQTAYQKSTENGCRTFPTKAEIARGTPSQRRTDLTRHLQQACP